MNEAARIFIGMAGKYNHFEDSGVEQTGHRCANCVRRQFGFPYTCHDGWPAGDKNWRDRGMICMNWTDDGGAKVD